MGDDAMNTATVDSHALHVAQRVRDVRGEQKFSPFARIVALSRGIPDLISLARGDPDLPTPPHIIAAAQQALAEGKTKYTVPAGLEELRRAIAVKLERENGLHYDPLTEIIVTAGAQEAVTTVLQTMLNPGDQVILPDPYYPVYRQALLAVGAKPVLLLTHLQDNFVIQPSAVAAAITPRTKAIILVSPGNPTGTVIDSATAKELCAVAREHNLSVISDELYEKIVFDGASVTSLAALPGMRETTVTINGFSKSYSMTGMRVGYFAAPASFIQAASELHHMTCICAPTVSQWAAVAALNGPQICIDEIVATYAERRRFMLNALAQMGIPTNNPQGAFYIFADIRAAEMPSLDFCLRLLQEAHVQAFPGMQYGQGGEGFLRLSFLAPLSQLEEAMERLSRFYRTVS